MQKITVAPGGHTGWHSHHGPVVIVVTTGAMTVYYSDDPSCAGNTFDEADPGSCSFE